MPKVINTRKQRALELLKRIERGPALMPPIDGTILSPKQQVEYYSQRYHMWANTWIRDELIDLVPELRKYIEDSQPNV